MKSLKFKCTLKTDVILNQKAASEGPNVCLDFIPGNNFLGIVAQKYDDFGEEAMTVFHSGKVRFGDAHPAHGMNRTLHVPASYYYPKLQGIKNGCYIHHQLTTDNLTQLREVQLKQCRSGFYDFTQKELVKLEVNKNFAIKSAYDKEFRRAKDSQMYGYQSMSKGLDLYFEVETDDDVAQQTIDKILEYLKGDDKRIGRSRTAQYGLVKIEQVDEFTQIEHGVIKDEHIVSVYADGRLIFLDKDLQPTFRPTVEDLGFKGGRILWDKCQIRTFQYAPWNFKRQSFDCDRCGIEKGSVFVIDISKCSKSDINVFSNYIGCYQNEGFGRVIYNPSFLEADSEGKSEYCFKEEKYPENPYEKEMNEYESYNTDSRLLSFLKSSYNQDVKKYNVYKLAQEWASANASLFKGETFSSQWGQIRAIALAVKTSEELMAALFKKENERISDSGYLMHGIASKKWEGTRLENFKTLVEKNEVIARELVINLASVMQKKMDDKKRKGEA